MKIIPSSKRHRYVAIVSIYLLAVALIAGMVGCNGVATVILLLLKYGIGMI